MAGVRPYRTELTPVSFLRRSAYVFPDKIAVVHGNAALHLPRVRGAGRTGWPPRCAPPA